MNGNYANGYGNGPVNGYGDSHATAGRYQHGEAESQARDGSLAPANIDQRVGGYGGLGPADGYDGSVRERPVARSIDSGRNRALRRGSHASRSRSRPRGGRANQQIEGQRIVVDSAHTHAFMHRDHKANIMGG